MLRCLIKSSFPISMILTYLWSVLPKEQPTVTTLNSVLDPLALPLVGVTFSPEAFFWNTDICHLRFQI